MKEKIQDYFFDDYEKELLLEETKELFNLKFIIPVLVVSILLNVVLFTIII